MNLLCERLLREREAALRDLYDRVLAAKLNEQYEAFVRFTSDQIQSGLSSEVPSCEYFSVHLVFLCSSNLFCLEVRTRLVLCYNIVI